jgi:hypothetical protein
MAKKKLKTSHSKASSSHSNLNIEPIDLTIDTPPKQTKNASAQEDDDELVITEVRPPPGVVITSYTPAENSQTTVLGLMANIMEKVNTHNLRHSPTRTTNSLQRPPKNSIKNVNNAPATVVPQENNSEEPTALRCAICLSSFSKGIELSATVCGHIFCQDCIDAALKQGKKVCPICRKDLKGKTAVHRLYI